MPNNTQKAEKPLCIMDTNAVLNSYRVTLAGRPLIDWIHELRTVLIPKSVKEELMKGLMIRLDGPQLNEIFTKYISQDHIYAESLEGCKQPIKKWFMLNKKNQQYHKLSDTDLDCIALALLKSRNVKNFVILSTDELNLKSELNNFLIEQKAGLLLTTPDMIVYFYSLYSQVGNDHVIYAFQYFKNLGYRNVEPRDYLGKNCRYMYLCAQECF